MKFADLAVSVFLILFPLAWQSKNASKRSKTSGLTRRSPIIFRS